MENIKSGLRVVMKPMCPISIDLPEEVLAQVLFNHSPISPSTRDKLSKLITNTN